MSDYATINPTFWTGETGRKLREEGPEAQLVALYLLSNSHRNPLGIYYLPKLLISHETALDHKGASKGLQRGIQSQFCAYDDHSEVVWVYKMASYQIATELKPGDKRVKWVNDLYRLLPNNPFLYAFYEEYGAKFHIEKPRGLEGAWKGLQCPIEANSNSNSNSNNNSSIKNIPRTAKQAISYPGWLDRELWSEFIEYRKTLKTKFTPKAEALCLRDLEKLIEEHGIESQRKIIEATLKSGKWLSFYPPRNGNGCHQPTKLDKTMEVFRRRELERQRQEAEDDQAEGCGCDPSQAGEVLPDRDTGS